MPGFSNEDSGIQWVKQYNNNYNMQLEEI